jgi:hypothetical protein
MVSEKLTPLRVYNRNYVKRCFESVHVCSVMADRKTRDKFAHGTVITHSLVVTCRALFVGQLHSILPHGKGLCWINQTFEQYKNNNQHNSPIIGKPLLMLALNVCLAKMPARPHSHATAIACKQSLATPIGACYR